MFIETKLPTSELETIIKQSINENRLVLQTETMAPGVMNDRRLPS